MPAAVQHLVGRVDRDGIDAAYLVRRELPSDPSIETDVLGIQLTWCARQRNRQQTSSTAWPGWHGRST